MKRTAVLVAGLVLISSLAFAGGKSEASGAQTTKAGGNSTRLKVQADIVPHAELLEFVKPTLAAQGIDIEIITTTDSSLANEQVANGELDVNFFQHEPYLKSIVAERGFDLVNGGNIHVEPIGAYSVKYKTVNEVPNNAKIAIPNDATNEYRALRILEQAGFITLKKGVDVYQTTVANTVDKYVKPITLQELDSALIIRVKEDFDVYITNTNKILEAGIDTTQVLFREGKDSPYANILAVKASRVNDPAIKALFVALTSEDVRKFIDSKYKGAVIPAF
ncbi:MetQ/NlpA family ABC transporter substrate-binding protein [Leadbettera azotonutricia]|uniref:Lipoprotein n=1 Tax=Leadbettera azotonutricia (strain ATCC BAA-888 / DSM 13862 / ZAS-9) TaxID=545695 RepID=F5Y708_LEAAZ|nr:MetQ/NlpA family ABC transporter substrate-binding protein [Leadbettera azotonutricia]AEF81408.1 D-methionine ABC transporter, periplasmic D-methionine-binding protein [Leadbettera azotonutricia ZAS-9]